MKAPVWFPTLCLAALLCFACGDDGEGDHGAHADAGLNADAGTPDARVTPDARTTTDASRAATCAVCEKADRCCEALAQQSAQPTSACILTRECTTAPAGSESSVVSACTTVLQAGASLKLPACM